MNRREELLIEMGLGPVWRLRSSVDTAVVAEAPVGEEAESADVNSIGVDTAGVDSVETDDRVHAAPKPRPPQPPMTPDMLERRERIAKMGWDELKSTVAECTACGLCKTRNKTVFGVGDESADWLIVGEAPGAEEDQRGEPFVGQAGQLLDSMLEAMDLSRQKKVYIANVLKCRPPSNRNPDAAEVQQCSAHLERQIALVKPKLILAMGRFATQSLLNTDASIASLRGKTFHYQGVPTVVTYHPAYLLRNLEDKAKSWEDLCYAQSVLPS